MATTVNLSDEWTLFEKIRLLELYIDKDSGLWEDRANKLREEFGSKRPTDFFKIANVKMELHKVFNKPNPEHHIFGLPSHPRGKEAAEMWLKHYRKELAEYRERRKQMFAVGLRRQLDLIRRHQQNKLPPEEVEAILAKARERDAQRSDHEEHEARIKQTLSKLHSEDLKNVRTLADYCHYLRGERVQAPAKAPSPVKMPQEPAPEQQIQGERVSPLKAMHKSRRRNAHRLEMAVQRIKKHKGSKVVEKSEPGKNDQERGETLTDASSPHSESQNMLVGKGTPKAQDGSAKDTSKRKEDEQVVVFGASLAKLDTGDAMARTVCKMAGRGSAELSVREAQTVQTDATIALAKAICSEGAERQFPICAVDSMELSIPKAQNGKQSPVRKMSERKKSPERRASPVQRRLRTASIVAPSSEAAVPSARSTRKRRRGESGDMSEESTKVERPSPKRSHIQLQELTKPAASKLGSPSISPVTVSSISSVTSMHETPLTVVKKTRTRAQPSQTPENVQEPAVRRSQRRMSSAATEELSRAGTEDVQAQQASAETIAEVKLEDDEEEISEFTMEAEYYAEQRLQMQAKREQQQQRPAEEESVVIETDEVEGLFPVTSTEEDVFPHEERKRSCSVGTQARLSVRHPVVVDEPLDESERKLSDKKTETTSARSTRSQKVPHSLGLQTEPLKFAKEDVLYVEREPDGGWPGGYYIRTITLDEQPVSSPRARALRSPSSHAGAQHLRSAAYSPLKQPLSGAKLRGSGAGAMCHYDADTCAQIEAENAQARQKELAEQLNRERALAAQMGQQMTRKRRPRAQFDNAPPIPVQKKPAPPVQPVFEEAADFNIKVILYPEGGDPDAAESGAPKVEEMVKAEESVCSTPSLDSAQQLHHPLAASGSAKLRSSLRRQTAFGATPSPAVVESSSVGGNGLFLRPGNHTSNESIPKQVLLTLWKDIHSHRHSYVFDAPVTESEVPGYHSAIRRPMDLKTIKGRIEAGTIRTFGQFSHAVVQMFANAVMYNSSGHHVNSYAKEMLAYALKCIEVVQYPTGQITAPSGRHSNGSHSDGGRLSRGSAATATPKSGAVGRPTNSSRGRAAPTASSSGVSALKREERPIGEQTRHLFQRRPPRTRRYFVQ